MVALILGTGFEPLEAVAPCDILRRSGIEVCCASVGERLVEAGHGIRIEADCTVAELDAEKLSSASRTGERQPAIPALSRRWEAL